MNIVSCTYEEHAEAILDIFNDAIVTTTALFVYELRTLDFMKQWFATKESGGYPVLGAVAEDGQLLGFASYGQFRPLSAYKYSVENSIYIQRSAQRQGIATRLMKELIAAACSQQYHMMVAAIDADNQGSIALHLGLGFEYAGTVREAAFKFGQWRDLAYYQLLLPTPDNPSENG